MDPRPATTGRIRSVNVGRPTPSRHTRLRVTGIDKRPTDGPVQVRAPGPKGVGGSGLVGDTVCDGRHHGGDDQAVYAYAREDLDAWGRELGRDLRDGQFGENLTTEGLDLTGALVGEIWSLDSGLELQVSVPRIPCRTFAGFLDEARWVRRFTEKGATGTYLRVLTPGEVRAGDTVTVTSRPDHGVRMLDMFRALTTEPQRLPDLARIDSLADEVRAIVTARTGLVPATDPNSTDPTSTDPTSTDPTSTDPASTDPTSTDPNRTR